MFPIIKQKTCILTREQMREVLVQSKRLFVEFPWALAGILGKAQTQFFYLRLAFWLKEDDDRCVLGVVKAIDGVWSDV